MKRARRHCFADAALERAALTHRDFGAPNNERLEWLGDALLSAEVSKMIYQNFPNVSEGGMSLIRKHLVNNEALAALARRLGLPERLRLGAANVAGGGDNDNILADAMEAYIAAAHFDGGDIGALLAEWLADDLARLGEDIRAGGLRALRDAKTRLQEFLQQRGLPPPAYEVVETAGPAHRRVFKVECIATAECEARGAGASRARAEQAAAAACLKQLSENPPR